MGVVTLEGIVEQGQIKITSGVSLPERTKVYIVVPDSGIVNRTVNLHSPRLARPEQATEFGMEVVES